MRLHTLTKLLAVALLGVASSAGACGLDAIYFRGTIRYANLHNHYLLCVNDSNNLLVMDLGSEDWFRRSTAWQKVGDDLFIASPDGSVCRIDLTTGTLAERIQVESRAGVKEFRVAGDLIYCVGSASSWAARIDHLTCVN